MQVPIFLFQLSTSYEENCGDNKRARNIGEENGDGWRLSASRRSVHEMIKRFQQVPGMHNGWRGPRSVSSEQTISPDHSQCSQRVQPQGTSSNGWHAESQGKINYSTIYCLLIH